MTDNQELSPAELLEIGIEHQNPQMIRDAAAAGAGLSAFPDRSVAPLRLALNRCRTGSEVARECVATLVELGCAIDGEPGARPTVVDCTGHTVKDDGAIQMLEVALSLGADVNAVDPESGNTALFNAVASGRKTIVEALMTHGADATITCSAGLTAVDRAQQGIQKWSDLNGHDKCREYREILSLLTREPVEGGDTMRLVLRECLGLDQRDRLDPQARFFVELNGNQADLRHFVHGIHNAFGVEIEPVLAEVCSLISAAADAPPTEELLQRVTDLLPGFASPMELARWTDVFTVSLLEAVVDKAREDSITKAPQVELTPIVASSLGERRHRLVLAGALRLATKANRRRDIQQAFEAIERYADTGKSKTALKSALRDLPRMNATQQRAFEGLLTEPPKKLLVDDLERAVAERYGTSTMRAAREIERLHRDVISPLPDAEEFNKDWRSQDVVELARSMYESRDFREMFKLADLLAAAGCDNRQVLDHCRDPLCVHIRGCWMVDAILDGSWAKPPRAKRKKKTRLSSLSKAVQHRVLETIEDGDGNLSLEEYLQKYWDVEREYDARFPGGLKRLNEEHAKLSERLPTLSAEQVRELQAVHNATSRLRDLGIARRVVQEDPGELARCLSVLHRLWPIRRLLSPNNPDVGEYLDSVAVGDLPVAREIAAATHPGFLAVPDAAQLLEIAVVAILRNDFETLAESTFELQFIRGWKAGEAHQMYFTGIIERDAAAIAAGLKDRIGINRRARQKDWTDAVIDLAAHGFYRLAVSVSPDLVAAFDLSEPIPWDKEFHEWCRDHPDPLAAADFNGISPVLHETVVLGRPPEWLPDPPQQYEVIVSDVDLASKKLLECVGGIAGAESGEFSQRLVEARIALRYNLAEQTAEHFKTQLEEAGAKAEVRVMEPKPFRSVRH